MEDEDDEDTTVESPVSLFFTRELFTDEHILGQYEDRAPSPDQVVVLSVQENMGPSEEAEAEFAKELAKMVTDSSAESRKVDKKTALAMWDSAVLHPTVRKKRVDENDDECDTGETNGHKVMNFTVITKRGSKHHVRVPIIILCLDSHGLSNTDSSIGSSCCIGARRSNAQRPNAGQGGTTTFETPSSRL